MSDNDNIKIIIKEIPYRIASCIVCVCNKNELFVSYYKELPKERKDQLLDKGINMFKRNERFYIEQG